MIQNAHSKCSYICRQRFRAEFGQLLILRLGCKDSSIFHSVLQCFPLKFSYNKNQLSMTEHIAIYS